MGKRGLFKIQEMDLKLVRQSLKSWLFRLFRVSHSHLLRREVEDKRPALDLVSLPVSPAGKRLNGKKILIQNFCKWWVFNVFFTSTQLESTVLSSSTTLKIRVCAYANISLAHPPPIPPCTIIAYLSMLGKIHQPHLFHSIQVVTKKEEKRKTHLPSHHTQLAQAGRLEAVTNQHLWWHYLHLQSFDHRPYLLQFFLVCSKLWLLKNCNGAVAGKMLVPDMTKYYKRSPVDRHCIVNEQ